MQNNDLLRIFTSDEIKDLSPDTLLKYRKQKLLMFQMTEKYTIKLNGHEVDKNTVISIFEQLETSLESLLVQHKIPGLHKFLSSPDLSTIYLILYVNFNNFSIADKAAIFSRISNKINLQLGNDILNGKIKPSEVKWITDFSNKHLDNDFESTFGSVYSTLSEYVTTLSEDYDQPYLYQHGTALKNEVSNILNGSFYKCLSALPQPFESIKIIFARWCHSKVLFKAFDRTTSFNKFSKSTLTTLQKAMYIAADYFQSEHHRDNAKLVSKYLAQNSGYNRTSKIGGNGSDSGCGGIGLIIGIFLFLIKFSILFKNCDRNNRSYRGESFGYSSSNDDLANNEAYKILMERINERERKKYAQEAIEVGRSSNSSGQTGATSKAPMVEEERPPPSESVLYPRGGSSVRSVKILKDYAGANKMSLNAEVKRIVNKDDLVEVYFSCNALPMYHESYSRLVPEKVKDKYLGQVIDAVFIFEPRGLRKAATHVSLKIDLKSKSKFPPTSFGFVKKSSEQAKKLHLRKIKTKDFKFEGYIQEYNVGDVDEQRKRRFNIKFDVSNKQYAYSEVGRSYKSLGGNISDEQESKAARYKSLVNNIKNIQDKYLRQASIYTIENSSYCINDNANDSGRMIFDEGILKMYITSIGDGNTYAELKMDDSHVNYIIDEEGYIKTVQQITYNKERKIVERILMTR